MRRLDDPGDAAGRREEPHARRQRGDVALREPLGARRALLVEVRAAHRPDDRLDARRIDAELLRLALLQADDEPDGAPRAERNQDRASHLDGVFGGVFDRSLRLGRDGIGVGSVERLRGDVQNDGGEFHATQYSSPVQMGARARRAQFFLLS